jgi:hypothetical protein
MKRYQVKLNYTKKKKTKTKKKLPVISRYEIKKEQCRKVEKLPEKWPNTIFMHFGWVEKKEEIKKKYDQPDGKKKKEMCMRK